MEDKMSIKVLIYIPRVDQTYGGIRQYALNLLDTLATLPSTNFSFFVYHSIADEEVLKRINANKNFTLLTDDEIILSSLSRKNFWRKKKLLISELIFGKRPSRFKPLNPFQVFVDKNNIQIIHVPYQDLPQYNGNARLITTMHDVQELHFPEFFSGKERATRATRFLNAVHRADKVVVSYEHIADDIIKYFGISKSKVQICLLNMGKLWFAPLQEKYKGSSPPSLYEFQYLLYPANFWPHKNHKNLIVSFSKLKSIPKAAHLKLVLTGNNDNAVGKEVREMIENYNLKDDVIFAGIVNEENLYATYKNALAVVVPTLYEAGSFPLMEAMIMQIPVICSNVTSLPATIQDEIFVFNPNDIEEMVGLMDRISFDQQYRNDSINNSGVAREKILETGAAALVKNLYKALLKT